MSLISELAKLQKTISSLQREVAKEQQTHQEEDDVPDIYPLH